MPLTNLQLNSGRPTLAVLLPLLITAAAAQPVTAGWQLVWSDEFNGLAGAPPDPAKWNFDLGGGGWGNGEAEVYTNSVNNAFQDGHGNLVIRAIKDAQGNYTSARLQTGAPGASTHTAGGNWQYGRIQARIKVPYGRGIWPAFWMLGENFVSAGWPACGEIDIMENFGTFHNNASINNGTAHGPGYSAGSGLTATYTLPFGYTVYDDYHVYALEWSPNSLVWYVDGAAYHTVTPASLPPGAQWVYNAPFFVLLNLAIGGPSTFLGIPDPLMAFPQDMLVDYVRVYQAATITATTPVITPGRAVNAASYLGAISPGGLATIYGNNFTGAQDTPGATSVSVNGISAPLTYASSTQVNLQVPWEVAPGPAVNVKVTRNGIDSNIEAVTIAAQAPAFFLSEYVNGIAWVTGNPADGCATPTSECSVQAGSTYQLWANGLGSKQSALTDGLPAPSGQLPVIGGTSGCQLTIGGQAATVVYCGAAPGEIIDQVNFIYPAGVTTTAPFASAVLTINGSAAHFRVPAPKP